MGGRWIHRLTNIDGMAADCSFCGHTTVVVSNSEGRVRCSNSGSTVLSGAEKRDLKQRAVSAAEISQIRETRQLQIRALPASNECEICHEVLDSDGVIDHSHQSGNVRGRICRGCNLGLGNFKDSPTLLQAALSYLSQHK